MTENPLPNQNSKSAKALEKDNLKNDWGAFLGSLRMIRRPDTLGTLALAVFVFGSECLVGGVIVGGGGEEGSGGKSVVFSAAGAAMSVLGEVSGERGEEGDEGGEEGKIAGGGETGSDSAL